jgi:hypothetical protein
MDNHKTVSRATQRVWFLKSAVLMTIWLAATFLAANVLTEDEPGKDVRLAGQLIGDKCHDIVHRRKCHDIVHNFSNKVLVRFTMI